MCERIELMRRMKSSLTVQAARMPRSYLIVRRTDPFISLIRFDF